MSLGKNKEWWDDRSVKLDLFSYYPNSLYVFYLQATQFFLSKYLLIFQNYFVRKLIYAFIEM